MMITPEESTAPPASPSIRDKIIAEIISTERTFVANQQAVILVYIEPLRSKALLSRDELSTLFSNWEMLHSFNTQFLQDLEACTGQAHCRIGRAFRQVAPYFRMFAHYLASYEHALDLKADLNKKNPKFTFFCEEAKKDSRCHGLDLLSLLILPVQRVPRYKLLLQELIKHTPETHHDYKDLSEALTLVSAAALHNNEHIRIRQNCERVMQLQASIDHAHSAIQVNLLDIPSRRFVRGGSLHRLLKGGAVRKRYEVWLMSDKILFGRPSSKFDNYLASEIKYHIKLAADLSEVALLDSSLDSVSLLIAIVTSPGSLGNSTFISSSSASSSSSSSSSNSSSSQQHQPSLFSPARQPFQGEVWHFVCANEGERDGWKHDLETAITAHDQSLSTSTSSRNSAGRRGSAKLLLMSPSIKADSISSLPSSTSSNSNAGGGGHSSSHSLTAFLMRRLSSSSSSPSTNTTTITSPTTTSSTINPTATRPASLMHTNSDGSTGDPLPSSQSHPAILRRSETSSSSSSSSLSSSTSRPSSMEMHAGDDREGRGSEQGTTTAATSSSSSPFSSYLSSSLSSNHHHHSSKGQMTHQASLTSADVGEGGAGGGNAASTISNCNPHAPQEGQLQQEEPVLIKGRSDIQNPRRVCTALIASVPSTAVERIKEKGEGEGEQEQRQDVVMEEPKKEKDNDASAPSIARAISPSSLPSPLSPPKAARPGSIAGTNHPRTTPSFPSPPPAKPSKPTRGGEGGGMAIAAGGESMMVGSSSSSSSSSSSGRIRKHSQQAVGGEGAGGGEPRHQIVLHISPSTVAEEDDQQHHLGSINSLKDEESGDMEEIEEKEHTPLLRPLPWSRKDWWRGALERIGIILLCGVGMLGVGVIWMMELSLRGWQWVKRTHESLLIRYGSASSSSSSSLCSSSSSEKDKEP